MINLISQNPVFIGGAITVACGVIYFCNRLVEYCKKGDTQKRANDAVNSQITDPEIYQDFEKLKNKVNEIGTSKDSQMQINALSEILIGVFELKQEQGVKTMQNFLTRQICDFMQMLSKTPNFKELQIDAMLSAVLNAILKDSDKKSELIDILNTLVIKGNVSDVQLINQLFGFCINVLHENGIDNLHRRETGLLDTQKEAVKLMKTINRLHKKDISAENIAQAEKALTAYKERLAFYSNVA